MAFRVWYCSRIGTGDVLSDESRELQAWESRWVTLPLEKHIPKPFLYLHALLPSLCGGRKFQDTYTE